MKKWIGGIVLIGIVAAAGNSGTGTDTESTAGSTSEAAAEKPASSPEPAATAEPTPTPKPDVSLVLDYPGTTRGNVVTVRGKVEPSSAKVRVRGERMETRRGRFSMSMDTSSRGANVATFLATKRGYTKATERISIVRKLSAAEKAVIRQERAARRANARALASAESYLSMSGFSKQGLYEQLSSAAGEGFTQAEAQYAVDHVDVDWNKEAVESARSYLDMSPMSKTALIEQLSSAAGEGSTYEQAAYAVNKVY